MNGRAAALLVLAISSAVLSPAPALGLGGFGGFLLLPAREHERQEVDEEGLALLHAEVHLRYPNRQRALRTATKRKKERKIER